MKFAAKLTVVISTLLCAALSLGGSWTVQQNFARVRQDLLRQSSRRQLYDRYALETAFAGQTEESLSILAVRYEAEQRALTTEEAPMFSLFGENGTVLYSDLPHSISYADQQQALAAGETEATFLRERDSIFCCCPPRCGGWTGRSGWSAPTMSPRSSGSGTGSWASSCCFSWRPWPSPGRRPPWPPGG